MNGSQMDVRTTADPSSLGPVTLLQPVEGPSAEREPARKRNTGDRIVSSGRRATLFTL